MMKESQHWSLVIGNWSFSFVSTPINSPNKTMSTGAPCNRFHRRKSAAFVGVAPQEIRPRRLRQYGRCECDRGLGPHFVADLAAADVGETCRARRLARSRRRMGIQDTLSHRRCWGILDGFDCLDSQIEVLRPWRPTRPPALRADRASPPLGTLPPTNRLP